MSTLEKTRAILHFVGYDKDTGNPVFTYNDPDWDRDTKINLDFDVWGDMWYPKTITVTIEPGDTISQVYRSLSAAWRDVTGSFEYRSEFQNHSEEERWGALLCLNGKSTATLAYCPHAEVHLMSEAIGNRQQVRE